MGKDNLKEELVLDEVSSSNIAKLIVHNDEFNTFEHVIDSLIDVLKMSSVTAEQISYIVHFKGKASVKSGDHDELKPFKDALNDRGLEVTIEM
jgi:ATP-dependent Clp protease adaptor protein ClpS